MKQIWKKTRYFRIFKLISWLAENPTYLNTGYREEERLNWKYKIMKISGKEKISFPLVI